ncbi:P2Y purinoceptor 1-like [Rhinatrema bivittatum]|uniref:P2Y purinoceptor 1-like n=1 Tax=Rhinatrema bivittatum TaxID=194408 RepID=UPI00112E91F6|nr:P2Y purinoceptor 1-like [Rhinatrema bivittatum]
MRADELSPRPPNASLPQCPVDKAFTARYLPAVYLLVFVVALLANAFGLWNLAVHWRKWSGLNVLVLNLGLADLLYAATLPFFVSYYLNGSVWPFGRAFCRLARGLFHLNLYASIGFLACISAQRYLGIVHPLAALGRLRALRPALLLSALVWGWVLVQILPELWFSKAGPDATRCHDSTGDEELDAYRPYTLVVTVTGFALPFLVILGCYSRVLAVLRRNTGVDARLRARSIKLVLLVTVLFALCFFPYHVLRNLNLLSRVWQRGGACSRALQDLYVAYQVTRGLACMNSALNPLVYLLTNENFVSRMRTCRERAWQACLCLGVRGPRRLSEGSATRDAADQGLCEVSEGL